MKDISLKEGGSHPLSEPAYRRHHWWWPMPRDRSTARICATPSSEQEDTMNSRLSTVSLVILLTLVYQLSDSISARTDLAIAHLTSKCGMPSPVNRMHTSWTTRFR